MRVLLEITTTNYKIWHSLAERLSEIYPGSEFAAIVGIAPGGEYVLDYLRKQGKVRYQYIRLTHEIFAGSLKGEVDGQLLAKFEEQLPQKSIWRIISADRGWGSAFMHGAVLRRTYISENSDRSNILKVFSGSLREINRIFAEFKPDIFLPAIAMGSILVFIFEEICRRNGVYYIVPTSNRIKNLFSFSADVQLRFPQIDKAYEEILSGKRSVDLASAEKLYDEIMGELEKPDYFDCTLPCFNIKKIKTTREKTKHVLRTMTLLVSNIKEWLKHRDFNRSQDIRRQPYAFRSLWENLVYSVKFQLQNYHILSPGFGDKLVKGQKYLYYPLHTSPEYSNQFQGTMWMDQLHLIECLAKSVPFDWVVYVKEHPATLAARVRPDNYLQKIMSYPNVRMAPVDADTHELIMNSEMVAVVTGTSGWEAIQRGKPLITFADNFWDVLKLSRRCLKIESIATDIREELRRINAISAGERKRRLIMYLAAVLEHSFKLTYPQQFCYEPGTDEQYRLGGREMADALRAHLDYLSAESARGLRL